MCEIFVLHFEFGTIEVNQHHLSFTMMSPGILKHGKSVEETILPALALAQNYIPNTYAIQLGSLLSWSAFACMAYKFVFTTLGSKTSWKNQGRLLWGEILQANKHPQNWFFHCRFLTSSSQIYGLQFFVSSSSDESSCALSLCPHQTL